MKILYSITILLLSLSILQCSKSENIATVGKEKITQNDLYSQHFVTHFKINPTTEIQKKYLDSIIYRKLLFLSAKNKNTHKETLNNIKLNLIKEVFSYHFLNRYYYLSKKIPLKTLRQYHANLDKSKISLDWNMPEPFYFEYSLKLTAEEFIAHNINYDSLYQLPKYKQYISIIIDSDTIVQPLNAKTVHKFKRHVFAEYVQKNFTKSFDEELLQEVDFRFIKPPTQLDSQVVMKEYFSNLKNYQTKPSFHTFYIEGSSKKSLEKIRESISNLKEFQKKSLQLGMPVSGNLGFVKEGHSLPNGLGLIPQIFTYFQSLKTETTKFVMTSAIQNIKTKTWYLFASNRYKPRQQKPLDRVYRKIERQLLEQETTLNIDQPLASYKDGIITERNYQDFFNTLSPLEKKTLNRNNTLKELVIYKAAVKKLKKLNFDDLEMYKYSIKKLVEEYWGNIYLKENLVEAYGFTNQDLSRIFNGNKEVFITKRISSVGQVDPIDLILFNLIPKQMFKIEYHTKPENYGLDSKQLSLKASLPSIFFRIKKDYLHLLKKQLIKNLSSKIPVNIIDSTLVPTSIPSLIKLAIASIEKDNFQQAITYYKTAQSFTLHQNLQDSISYQLARIYFHNKEHYNALAEYRRLLYLFPASRFNCQSQFMISYIKTDIYKENEVAINGFKRLMEKYPNCPLITDAKFMIKDLSKRK